MKKRQILQKKTKKDKKNTGYGTAEVTFSTHLFFLKIKMFCANLRKHLINPIEDFSVLTLNVANCP